MDEKNHYDYSLQTRELRLALSGTNSLDTCLQSALQDDTPGITIKDIFTNSTQFERNPVSPYPSINEPD